MKKKYLIIGSLAFLQFFNRVKAQSTINKVNQTQIDVVYNHYIQDGDNSAVTGGVGSEELTVYGPSIGIQRNWDNKAFKLHMGADIISSVSTDNIDSTMSSASILDQRTYANTTYEHTIKNDLTLYGGGGFSVESDYFSLGSKIGFVKEGKKNFAKYSAEFQMFNDDLRWGRLDQDHYKPVKLIYPRELRDTEWFDRYRRNSYNLKLGYSQAINKRALLGIYPVLTYQSGLLSTTFHRIYFTDDSQAVENLPKQRLKASLGIKWNQFVGGRYVLKSSINPYIDDWGILAVSVDHETAIKINSRWTISPNARFYIQKGSRYFAGYKEHLPTSDFHTSDYDLADNKTYNIGIGFKYSPETKLWWSSTFKTIGLRYNYMHRTNGLYAHILSMNIKIDRIK